MLTNRVGCPFSRLSLETLTRGVRLIPKTKILRWDQHIKLAPSGKIFIKQETPLDILIVEDTEDYQAIFSALLTNHTVTIRKDLETAFKTLEEDQFDFVITDLKLGEAKNGFEVIKKIRSLSQE